MDIIAIIVTALRKCLFESKRTISLGLDNIDIATPPTIPGDSIASN
jgi:hypothetical protein